MIAIQDRPPRMPEGKIRSHEIIFQTISFIAFHFLITKISCDSTIDGKLEIACTRLTDFGTAVDDIIAVTKEDQNQHFISHRQ